MKRQILTLGAICAAAFTLTNCNKEIAEPKAPVTEGIPFEIVAATADTKTENDGLNTKWTTGDALNVFHAEAGSIDYGTNDQFKYTGADNKFKGTLKTALGGGKSYDWYALYPYDNRIKNPTGTPFGTGGNYTLIGKKNGKDTGDTQDGNDSKAHLSGKSCPMYAVAENVAASDVPTFTMKHLTSVVAVTVTNANDAPLTVNSVSFSAPEGTTIFGSFFINFTENGDAVYTNHGTAAWTSNTSNLTVKNGTPIAKNGKATFYLAIKPFAAKTGDELKISVNGYEKTRKLTEDVEFKAGKIEGVNFNYNAAPTPGTTVSKTIAELTGLPASGEKLASIKLDEVITVTADGTGNNGKYYSSNNSWRFYQNGNGGFTIKAASGHTLKKATITFTIKNSGTLKYSGTAIVSGKAVSLSGDSASFNIGSTTGTNGAVFVTAISVTYE